MSIIAASKFLSTEYILRFVHFCQIFTTNYGYCLVYATRLTFVNTQTYHQKKKA